MYLKELQALQKLLVQMRFQVWILLSYISSSKFWIILDQIMLDLNIAVWNIRSMNKQKKQKDVLNFIREEKLSICGIVETHIKPTSISKIADYAFGGWDWVSNISCSSSGCRILVGWDRNKMDVMAVHITKQVMLVAMEILQTKQKMFCSFVYAANTGLERRNL